MFFFGLLISQSQYIDALSECSAGSSFPFFSFFFLFFSLLFSASLCLNSLSFFLFFFPGSSQIYTTSERTRGSFVFPPSPFFGTPLSS